MDQLEQHPNEPEHRPAAPAELRALVEGFLTHAQRVLAEAPAPPELTPKRLAGIASLNAEHREYIRWACDLAAYTKAQIADKMRMEFHEVDKLQRAVYKKLDVHTHGTMVRVAMLAGLV